MFSVVVLFPWTRREKVSLVVFSVVVLFFDEGSWYKKEGSCY